jgi:hypothetical protein
MGLTHEPLRFAPRDGGHAPHAVVLSGLRGDGARAKQPPLLLERRDEDFVDGTYADLRDTAKRADLFTKAQPRKTRPKGLNRTIARLYAPVQRVFNLALFEAFCDQPGLIPTGDPNQPYRPGDPRLDPVKIDSRGMVLRRVLAAPVNGARYEAWIKSDTKTFGWDAIDPDHEDDDPAADRRLPAVSAGNAAVNARLPSNVRRASALSRRLVGQKEPVHEAVTPLFVAPPDVLEATGKTVLFGVIQVASNEMSEIPGGAPGYGKDAGERQQLKDHLVNYLKEGGPRTFARAGETFTSAWALAVGKQAAGSPEALRNAEIAGLTDTLRQLGVEFDAFNETSPAAKTLRDKLDALTVEYDERQSNGSIRIRAEKASVFFKRAHGVLLMADDGASFTMPHRLSYVSRTPADALFDATLGALDAQYKALKPGKGRFEADSRDSEARYVVRAFIRLKPEHEGCPARILWSPYSEEFTIAPWYESAGQPPHLVELPDLFDRNVLKSLKPNVAFTVPPKLAKLIAGDAKDLRDGKGDEGDGLGLAWICSFSIPIITICAFIVLSIFLSLLNLIFWWLPFLKICIPFPKKLP